jgi:hypothetical protein
MGSCHERAVVCGCVCRRADLKTLDARCEPFHKIVRSRFADRNRDRHRHAALAGRAVTRADERIDGLIHVGIGHDNHMVLGSAKALHARSNSRAARVNIFGNRRRADKADGLDAGIVKDGIDGFLITVDDVENARGEPGLDHEFSKSQRNARIALGWFQHECITAGDRGAELPHRDHGRKIEGRNASCDAKRLTHRVDVDAGARGIGEFALHQMGNAGCEFDHLGAALNVAFGVGDCLAMFAGEEFGERFHVAGEEFEKFHQNAGAALRIRSGPGRLRGDRGFDSGAHFRFRSEGDT